MNITASMVKELRDKTDAGMMDCKKALTECNGDMDAAIDYLREKGISKAAKKADRIAAEGLSNIYVDGNKAVILEINSETDFVAKNEKFIDLVDLIGNTLLKNNETEMDKALELKTANGTTINEEMVNATATIGEKLDFRRFKLVTKKDNEVFGAYLHMGGKISSLVVVEGSDEASAKDAAMQAAAMRPKYALRSEVPASEVEHEREILIEQAHNEEKPKPDNIIEKMVNGRLEKFYEEIVLNEQPFIKDGDLTIEKYLAKSNCVLKSMVRFEVGEGIEKRVDDLASEVAKQINETK